MALRLHRPEDAPTLFRVWPLPRDMNGSESQKTVDVDFSLPTKISGNSDATAEQRN